MRSFTNRREFHRPRIWRGAILVFLGVALLARGWYLIANDLPDDSIHRLQVTVQATWMIWGIALLAFGAYGLVTGALGMMRKGVDAIDLELGPDRAVVNGSHTTGVIRMRGGRPSLGMSAHAPKRTRGSHTRSRAA